MPSERAFGQVLARLQHSELLRRRAIAEIMSLEWERVRLLTENLSVTAKLDLLTHFVLESTLLLSVAAHDDSNGDRLWRDKRGFRVMLRIRQKDRGILYTKHVPPSNNWKMDRSLSEVCESSSLATSRVKDHQRANADFLTDQEAHNVAVSFFDSLHHSAGKRYAPANPKT